MQERKPDGSRWTTTVRSWSGPATRADPGGLGAWTWVDVDAAGPDLLDGVDIAAPRFVRALLGGGTARRSDLPLSTHPVEVTGAEGAEELAELLTGPERDLPVVVFAPLPAGFTHLAFPDHAALVEAHRRAADSAAAVAAGLAVVFRLDDTACTALAAILGAEHTVRDGALRIYLPGLDPALAESWRHRYVVAARFIRNRAAAGRVVMRAIAVRSGGRVAPVSYDVVEPHMRPSGAADSAELLELALEEIAQLTTALGQVDDRYTDAVDEQVHLGAENGRLREEVRVLRRKLAAVAPSAWEARAAELAAVDADRWPEGADSPSEAVEQARVFLAGHLDIPESACRKLDRLDAAVQARAWGATAWRGFVALHRYAEDKAGGEFDGSFWNWCERSGAWPATEKKLAMSESQTVNRDERLRAKRVFEVPAAVAPGGRLFMEAHLKIAEGGGSLAPRVYFHYAASTGKVHVGLFGPHSEVPNTRA